MSRVLLRSLVALVLVAAAGLIGWRVLAPAEVLSPAATPYPLPSVVTAQVTGRTNVAPLIVDQRIRVYAGQRQVRADGPVDAKTVNTARWSLRRWPATVSGVVAAGTTVISRWSDGVLVAVDARSGRESWRVNSGPAPAFDGHRTGASTVWAPAGLHVAADSVLVQADQKLSAYEVDSGALLWTVTVPAGCGDGFTTLGGQYFCATGGFDAVTGVALPAYGEGPYTPLTCGVAVSACQGMRDARGQGFLTTGVTPRRVVELDDSDISVVDGAFERVPSGVQVLGVSSGRLVVLTADRHLQVLRSGHVVADFPLAVGSERLDWKPGLWQVTDGWVAIERLTGDGPADPGAPEHYFTVDTVIIASLLSPL
ncbi:PQQ-like beta-propeller repeat protein [Actinoplanes bogorensis]|uniref:PQQ-like beta-propeller repeat protein n=1 Tax=Paractinoplanes bogorensis TaxID=1610840 RepID=A0ABS5YIF1_9ACTN|nr:PQQ-binding-like beta-propeller repeat protein [Actinoplanes bogorensis]MBU2663221.1 PQQ-like beta-propeller repeat protein [Actinoplanes bogorensis]